VLWRLWDGGTLGRLYGAGRRVKPAPGDNLDELCVKGSEMRSEGELRP